MFKLLCLCNASNIDFTPDGIYGVCNSCGFSAKNPNVIDSGAETKESLRYYKPPVDFLFSKGNSFIEQKKFRAAANVFNTIRLFYPADYRGHWGSILYMTINFTSVSEAMIPAVKSTFDYCVKPNAGSDILPELEKLYNEFMDNPVICPNWQEKFSHGKFDDGCDDGDEEDYDDEDADDDDDNNEDDVENEDDDIDDLEDDVEVDDDDVEEDNEDDLDDDDDDEEEEDDDDMEDNDVGGDDGYNERPNEYFSYYSDCYGEEEEEEDDDDEEDVPVEN
ncbi:MAG: hypothetical protein LBC70_02740 [Chitinispirillales bacterium]|jgi:hypothetical protein|nr:hypothetical protein [Chitinispirillales bacterium]